MLQWGPNVSLPLILGISISGGGAFAGPASIKEPLPSYCVPAPGAHPSQVERRHALINYLHHIAPGVVLRYFSGKSTLSGAEVARVFCWGSIQPWSDDWAWELSDRAPVLVGIDRPSEKDLLYEDGRIHGDSAPGLGVDGIQRPAEIEFRFYHRALPVALMLQALGRPTKVRPTWTAAMNNIPDSNGLPGATFPYRKPTSKSDIRALRKVGAGYEACWQNQCGSLQFVTDEHGYVSDVISRF